jgi:hypothetical protein
MQTRMLQSQVAREAMDLFMDEGYILCGEIFLL